ncbi:DUF4136 domain-containing protein [Sphingomicrobium nitratireducens]|uniref:DUF4136 domain-containing protein n=1 Tax=Sphingomicrobium nitratireducens TaxID=2964666 RepID=UPI0022409264|nr:DUF4136 domain-containing protein [Sphingomicrobium nitratireducens]
MRKFVKAALASVAIMGLSACATGLPTKVSRYQAMPATAGQSFVVVPKDAAKIGSLEFERFSALVSNAMQQQGYAPAASIEDATMVVQVGYDVDDGRTRIVHDPLYDSYAYRSYWGARAPFYYSRYRPYYSRYRYYGPRRAFYYGWDDPFWFSPYGQRIQSYTEYRSELELDIRRTADSQMLFEGTAQARSRTDDLGTLMPNLVTAMFTDFPGKSGETVRITVKPDKDER